jgi:ectoine hydroxylase-related dioxygenase (phytanoyl-CoA dioxygenase family)
MNKIDTTAHRDWSALKASYDADGVVLLPALIQGAWLSALQDAVAEYRKRDPGNGQTQNFSRSPGRVVIRWMGREIEAVQQFVTTSGVAPVVAQLCGATQLKFWYDLTLVYTVGSPYGGSPWHHDIPAFPFRGTQMPSLWIALSPVDEDRSPLVFVKGSHKSGTLYPPSADGTKELPPGYAPQPDWDGLAARGEVEKIWWPMQAGDALLMHQNVVHSTTNNRSKDGERISIITRWIGEDVRWQRDAFSMQIPGIDPTSVADGAVPTGDAFIDVKI